MADTTQPMQGRWARELTENEIKAVLQAKKFETATWEFAGMEFFCSRARLAIVRTSGLGGDTYNVHGGWKYGNLIALLQDWTEIKSIASKNSVWKKDQ